jgi:hypothetical protein
MTYVTAISREMGGDQNGSYILCETEPTERVEKATRGSVVYISTFSSFWSFLVHSTVDLDRPPWQLPGCFTFEAIERVTIP